MTWRGVSVLAVLAALQVAVATVLAVLAVWQRDLVWAVAGCATAVTAVALAVLSAMDG